MIHILKDSPDRVVLFRFGRYFTNDLNWSRDKSEAMRMDWNTAVNLRDSGLRGFRTFSESIVETLVVRNCLRCGKEN